MKREDRESKLAGKREMRERKKRERQRIEELVLATRYSELKSMSIDDLKDQLKGYKLQGKTGFTLTHPDRTAYVIQVQALMCEALGAAANDLPDGDSGIEGRGVRRRRVDADGGKPSGKRKRARKIVEYNGYEWYANEEFEIEKLIGKMVAAGEVPGRTNVKKGTVLYKVLWKGFPPEIATWEEEENIHDDFIDDYEAELEAEEEIEDADEDSDGEDEQVGDESQPHQ